MLNQVNSHNEYALIKNNKAKLENRLMESETDVESCTHFHSKTKHAVEKLLFISNTFFVECKAAISAFSWPENCTVAIPILQHSNIAS